MVFINEVEKRRTILSTERKSGETKKERDKKRKREL